MEASFPLVPDLLLFFTKNKLYKILDYCSIDMLNFDFLEKGLGIVSAPHSFSTTLNLTLSFQSNNVSTWPKSQGKNWNILKRKRALTMK